MTSSWFFIPQCTGDLCGKHLTILHSSGNNDTEFLEELKVWTVVMWFLFLSDGFQNYNITDTWLPSASKQHLMRNGWSIIIFSYYPVDREVIVVHTKNPSAILGYGVTHERELIFSITGVVYFSLPTSGVPGGWMFGVFKPPEILKALQNRAKLNPIVKTVKNCWIWDDNTPRCSEKRQ